MQDVIIDLLIQNTAACVYNIIVSLDARVVICPVECAHSEWAENILMVYLEQWKLFFAWHKHSLVLCFKILSYWSRFVYIFQFSSCFHQPLTNWYVFLHMVWTNVRLLNTVCVMCIVPNCFDCLLTASIAIQDSVIFILKWQYCLIPISFHTCELSIKNSCSSSFGKNSRLPIIQGVVGLSPGLAHRMWSWTDFNGQLLFTFDTSSAVDC